MLWWCYPCTMYLFACNAMQGKLSSIYLKLRIKKGQHIHTWIYFKTFFRWKNKFQLKVTSKTRCGEIPDNIVRTAYALKAARSLFALFMVFSVTGTVWMRVLTFCVTRSSELWKVFHRTSIFHLNNSYDFFFSNQRILMFISLKIYDKINQLTRVKMFIWSHSRYLLFWKYPVISFCSQKVFLLY